MTRYSLAMYVLGVWALGVACLIAALPDITFHVKCGGFSLCLCRCFPCECPFQ